MALETRKKMGRVIPAPRWQKNNRQRYADTF
jgi:hypothetical protein